MRNDHLPPAYYPPDDVPDYPRRRKGRPVLLAVILVGVCGVLAAGIVLAALMVNHRRVPGMIQGNRPVTKVAPPARRPDPPPPPASEVESFPIEKIAEEYRYNAARADAFYAGRPIRFTMTADAIEAGSGGKYKVVQQTGEGLIGRDTAYFDQRWGQQLSRVKPGETIRARGKFLRCDRFGLTLQDCELE